MVLISQHWLISFCTAQDLLMKDKTCLRLKGLSPTFREKPTLVLHQYFFMVIRVFQLNSTPTYSVYLMTAFIPRKGPNLLSSQRSDSYLRSLKFWFLNLLDLFSLHSCIFFSFLLRFCSFLQVYKKFYYIWLSFFRFIYLFLYILFMYIYKNYVDFKNVIKFPEKVFGFIDNYIRIGCRKFSVL